MRIILLLPMLFSSLIVFAQADFGKSFRSIIMDTASGFSSFRGELKPRGDYEIQNKVWEYESNITLPGTKYNFISCHEIPVNIDSITSFQFYYYNTVAADSLKEKRANKICDDWKEKIANLLGNGYTIGKFESKTWSPVTYGWNFSNGNIRISTGVMPLNNVALSSVWVTISYSNYRYR